MAFPPLDLWPLAYVAVVPWTLIIRQPKLTGRRPYLVIYAAALVHWLALLQGIRLAHWALYFGWMALSAYVACYTPVMIACARVMVHRLRIPVVLAVPVAWVGIELIRGYVISGFSMGLLGHTQIDWLALLQVADLGGAYVVSFLIAMVSAAIACLVPLESTDGGKRWSYLPAVAAACAMVAAVGYGHFRLSQSEQRSSSNTADPVRVALIQGSLDTVFDVTPERIQETFEQYGRLTREVREREEHLDLVVWPESMFPIARYEIEEPVRPPPGSDLTPEHLRARIESLNQQFNGQVDGLADMVQNRRPAVGDSGDAAGSAKSPGVATVICTGTLRFGPVGMQHFNSALLIDGAGQVESRYDKMHAVMCGEYMPLGDLFPWIYGLTPLPAGLTVGKSPETFEVRGLKFSPSICFESTVPHLIREQVNDLERRGSEPDALLNVTNDGWFWGSEILDLHYRCSIFRAIENRKPMVIAANTGFSAWIDGDGRVLKQGPRRATTTLVADVRPDGRSSPYRALGDLFAGLCAALVWVAAVVGVWARPARAG